MIGVADKALAEHEATHAAEPWVLIRARGWQPGVGSMPGRYLFNVVAGDYLKGSTVTIETLLKHGFRMEVVQ